VSNKTKGKKFDYNNSFFVDDTAFVLMNRADLEAAARLVKTHFRRFGLTVHCGDTRNVGGPKTEIMFIRGKGCPEATDEEKADVMLSSHEYFGFCKKFKYLGTMFDEDLNDSVDVKRRIQQATGVFHTLSKFLKDPKISHKLRMRAYDATVVNILLYGCESWALRMEDRRKLEVCHNRFLRSMLNITIYNVKDYHITNDQVREELQCYTIEQSMELRRARWLEKLAHMPMERSPRRLLVAWTPHPRPRGKPCHTIKKAFASTCEILGIEPNLIAVMPMAKREEWASWVETKLGIRSGTYKPMRKRRN